MRLDTPRVPFELVKAVWNAAVVEEIRSVTFFQMANKNDLLNYVPLVSKEAESSIEEVNNC